MTKPLDHVTSWDRATGSRHGAKARIKISLEPHVLDQAAAMAHRANVPLSALLRRIVTDHVVRVAGAGTQPVE